MELGKLALTFERLLKFKKLDGQAATKPGVLELLAEAQKLVNNCEELAGQVRGFIKMV